MKNPWEKIQLSDYENHMKFDSIMQLQAMNEMMKIQFDSYPISSVIILGIAGGNGLEHIQKEKFSKVYGIDINSDYLKEVANRYKGLNNILELLCINLKDKSYLLPKADMIIANLLIEYIGYECFQRTVLLVNPKYVSCIIQVNTEENWISNSPYLKAFDELERVYLQIEEQKLINTMKEIDYRVITTLERLLPNEKKLLQIDFKY